MSLLAETVLKHHACSIERVSDSGFVCGTYELDSDSDCRAGDLFFLQYDDGSKCVKILSGTSCDSGVLDIKVCGNVMGTVMSAGCIDVYHLTQDVIATKLHSAKECDEGLFLSLDFDQRWATIDSNTNSSNNVIDCDLAVSTQMGSIIVYQLAADGLHKVHHMAECHTMFGEVMPAWITIFNPHGKHCVLSGGDDCKFKLWDLRTVGGGGTERCTTATPTAVNKAHTAGVTSAQWHPTREHVFATGSYDEHCMVWDARSLGQQPLLDIHAGVGAYYVCCTSMCMLLLVWIQFAPCGVNWVLLLPTSAVSVCVEVPTFSRCGLHVIHIYTHTHTQAAVYGEPSGMWTTLM